MVGAHSSWKYAGMPTPLSHAYLAGCFAAGAPAGLGREDLEPHHDLVIIDTTAYSFGIWRWTRPVGASATARGHQKRARACTFWFLRPRLADLPPKATSKCTRSGRPV